MSRTTTLGVAAALLAGSAASAATITYALADHPDGNAAPPPYGLRMDGIFSRPGATNRVTSFSFGNTFDNVFLRYDTVANTVNIRGTVYGGEDQGGQNPVPGFGRGFYELNFTYSLGVQTVGTGYQVDNNTPVRSTGSLTALGNNNGVAQGSVFSFSEMDDGTGRSFYFLQDDHRLQGHSQFGQGFWVGRGWMGGHSQNLTQDFLFIGRVIPLPSAAGMGFLGLALTAAVRRRKA